MAVGTPVAANVPPLPDPNLREFRVGPWELWCTYNPATGLLDNCALSTMVGWATIRVQAYGGKMNYSISRYCIRDRDKNVGEYRSGDVATGPIHPSPIWRDFAVLYDLPVNPECTGTPPGIGGNFQQDMETALAMLRSLHPLLRTPVPPTP